MAETPRISLCVAMYNVAQYLPRFIASLAKQPNWAEMELIVVNDGSTDDSEAVLRRELEAHGLMARTRILQHAENQGISQTRQDGLDAARGTYVIWADPDDTMEPGMYQDLADAADREQADMVWCDFWCKGGTGDSLISYDFADPEAFFCGLMNAKNVSGGLWNKLFRLRFLMAHDIRYPEGRVSLCEDVAFLTRAMHHRPRIHHLRKAYYAYYTTLTGVTQRYDPSHIFSWLTAIRCYEAAAQTEREVQALHRAKQDFKRRLVFSVDCRIFADVSYDFVRDTFPEVRSLNGLGFGLWPQGALFWLSLRNRFLWHACWWIYRTQKRLGQLRKRRRQK